MSSDKDISHSESEASMDGENGSMDISVIQEDLNYSINRYCNYVQEPSTYFYDHRGDIHEDPSGRTEGRHFA